MCSTSDSDGDGVINATDNCQFIPNPGQEDFDSDNEGDVCDSNDDGDAFPDASDPDDDNDGVTDVDEAACGGTTPSMLRPERRDSPFQATDDDGDTLDDEALPGGSSAFDCDGDGYTGAAEVMIFPSGNYDQDACNTDGWPAELASGSGTEDRVTLADLGSFFAPAPAPFNTNPPDPGHNDRWDIIPGQGAYATDINLQDLGALLAGSTATPAMLGGVMVFNGPECPW
jgi:hypothetical protein